MQSAVPAQDVVSEWKHLQRRVRIQGGMPEMLRPKRYSLRQAVAVAAVIVVVLLGGSYGIFSLLVSRQIPLTLPWSLPTERKAE